MIEVWFDGCCEPVNPRGHGGYGAAIYIDGKLAHEISGYIPAGPQTSNNVAEYSAFLAALEWLAENGYREQRILFRGDSKLVIYQMFSFWQMHRGFYIETALKAQARLKEFPRASGRWVPRDRNQRADRLSKAELRRRGIRFRLQPDD